MRPSLRLERSASLPLWVLLCVASAAMAGCGGDTAAGVARPGGGSGGAGCPAGSEGCACYGNATCDARLTCASHLCVNFGTGGSAQGGMSAGGSGPSLSSGGLPTTGGSGGGSNPGTGGSAGTPTSGCAAFVGLESCGTATRAVTLQQVNTLLVLDKSGSMANQPAGYAQSKWAALTQALTTVLPDTQGLMAYGLELFPDKTVTSSCGTGGVDCCAMPATGTMNVTFPGLVTDITTLLSGTVPGGGTPTAQALKSALNYFRGAGANLLGRKVVLLATDGGPNCDANIPGGCPIAACTYNIEQTPAACSATLNCCDPAAGGQVGGCLDTAEAVSAINQLSGDGIATVVLGLPGTEIYSNALEAMAQAGGLPNPSGPPSYYAAHAADGVQGLTNTIRQITTQLITRCYIQLDTPIQDPALVNVAIDCNVLKAPDPTTGSGDWYLDTTSTPETVVLQGAACQRVMTQGAQRIDVIVGCAGVTQ
jgi:hypothetical protein